MDREIVFYLSPEQDLYHASSIYAGLCQLSNQRAIHTKFIVSRGSDPWRGNAHTALMRVTSCKSRENFLIAIDLSDHSTLVLLPALEACDLYLKRSFHKPDLHWVPDNLRAKIFPFGLNYASTTSSSVSSVMRKLLPKFFVGALAKRGALRGHFETLEKFLTIPTTRAFEYDSEQKVEPAITFQTRVWSPDEATDDVHELNEERVSLLRTLKKAFGSRFQGGLVPTVYAKQRYPDLLSPFSAKHSRYISWSKKHLIGINTRGLHHSTAFKLAEYFAASKCIVTCPLRNELPIPLVEGQHCLVFRTIDQCVEHCENLLSNFKLASGLRQEAWSYYQREIEPTAHLRNCLARLDAYAAV